MAGELRGCIPREVSARLSGSFPPSTSNYVKTVKVAARYILELRRESERQKRELDELKTDYTYVNMEKLEAIVKEQGETIKEKEAQIQRIFMSGIHTLVDDMSTSEISKLQSQNEAKEKEIKALKQRVEELHDLLLGIDSA